MNKDTTLEEAKKIAEVSARFNSRASDNVTSKGERCDRYVGAHSFCVVTLRDGEGYLLRSVQDWLTFDYDMNGTEWVRYTAKGSHERDNIEGESFLAQVRPEFPSVALCDWHGRTTTLAVDDIIDVVCSLDDIDSHHTLESFSVECPRSSSYADITESIVEVSA